MWYDSRPEDEVRDNAFNDTITTGILVAMCVLCPLALLDAGALALGH